MKNLFLTLFVLFFFVTILTCCTSKSKETITSPINQALLEIKRINGIPLDTTFKNGEHWYNYYMQFDTMILREIKTKYAIETTLGVPAKSNDQQPNYIGKEWTLSRHEWESPTYKLTLQTHKRNKSDSAFIRVGVTKK
jgi:hypothetical protein